MKFCLLFNLSPCARYYLLIGSQLTTWSQGNLHFIRLHFFQLDREFLCLLPSLTRLYSAAASPSERLRSDGSLAIIIIINIDVNNSNNIYFLLLLLLLLIIIIIIINEITVETSCFFHAELVSLAAVFCLITQHSFATKEEERCVTRQKWLQELAVLYHNCSN